LVAKDLRQAGVLVGGGESAPRPAPQRIVVNVGVVVAVAQLHGGPDQQRAEDQKSDAEPLDGGGAHGDEDRPHDQRGDDTEQQHPVLVGGRVTAHRAQTRTPKASTIRMYTVDHTAASCSRSSCG
jgi:hypothetical protein